MLLDDSNFLLFAAKYYDNPNCKNVEEFYDDVKRFKYISRLFGKYKENGDLKERLIINHINIIFNMFGDSAVQMLFLRLDSYHSYLVPFLILIGKLPEKIILKRGIINTSDIPLDSNIVNKLRNL